MLLVLSIIGIVAGIAVMIWKGGDDWAIGGFCITLFSIMFLVGNIMVYCQSSATVREMKDLYRNGFSYEEVVDNVRESIAIEGITWEQLRGTMIDFIELEEKYIKYNEDFYRLKEYNDSIWLSWSYANLPYWIRADIGGSKENSK